MTNENFGVDVDAVLSYEKQCYNQGWKEGIEAGQAQGFLEGRELGIQTGFQRYIQVGVLQGRLSVWQTTSGAPERPLKQLEKYLKEIGIENEPQTVDLVERRTKLARNRARILASSGYGPPIDTYEQKIPWAQNFENF